MAEVRCTFWHVCFVVCAAVICHTAGTELESLEHDAGWEALVQKNPTPDDQPGSPLQPKGRSGVCVTAEKQNLLVAAGCDGRATQQWFYDRLAGGLLKTAHPKPMGDIDRLCLTREKESIVLRECGGEEEIVQRQTWQFLCGALVNGEGRDARVLGSIGSKVYIMPWEGSQTQLFDYKERVAHSQCANKRLKTLAFDGSGSTVAKLHSFINMPTTDITMAFWLNGTSGTPVSYGTKTHRKAFVVANIQELDVYIQDTKVSTGIKIPESRAWEHLAITWSSTTGDLIVYLNGQQKFMKAGVAEGTEVTPGGCLMLGQQQSSECTSTAPGRSFHGELTDFEVWSKVLSSKDLHKIMIKPVEEKVTAKVNSITRAQADPDMRLAYLSRQYALQELNLPFPPVCPLDAFALPDKPPGLMSFSASGDVHYRSFSECAYTDQSIGEWVAVKVKPQWWQAAPLEIQFRTSPTKTECKECQNGYVGYVDGCAVKYGDDRASSGFGGFDEANSYEPHSSMNGATHQGWKTSDSGAMDVNFGIGSSFQRHFEVRLNDGTYIKCAPRSIYIALGKKYAGKIHGVAGTGVPGKDWEAGPNQKACPDCKPGEQVEGTNGKCNKKYPFKVIGDPFNGNSFAKPVVKLFRSWQVDGVVVPSAFYYMGSQVAGSFNRNSGDEIKPPLEMSQVAAVNAEATKACEQFESTPRVLEKCVFDFKMRGAVAVEETAKDEERQRQAEIRRPTEQSVRDLSRYRNDGQWMQHPSWGCADGFNEALASMQEQHSQASNGMFETDVPVEGKFVKIVLVQKDAMDDGYTKVPEGQLVFSEIEIYDQQNNRIVPAKLSMSSTAAPEHDNNADMCLDNDVQTDCRTNLGDVNVITAELTDKQVVTKVRLLDTKDSSFKIENRNFGAVVMILDHDDLSPAWQSPAIVNTTSEYTFTPMMPMSTANMSTTEENAFNDWSYSSPGTKASNNSIVIPKEEVMRSRRKFKADQYITVAATLKAPNPGPISVSLFSRSCKGSRGLALVLNADKGDVGIRQGRIVTPVLNVHVDPKEWVQIGVEVKNSLFEAFINGQSVVKGALENAIQSLNGRICFHAGSGPLSTKDIEVTVAAPVGRIQKTEYKKAEEERMKAVKDKIASAKRGYFAEKKAKKTAQAKLDRAEARKTQELEIKEAKQKVEQRDGNEKHSKEDAIKCKERKVKDDIQKKLDLREKKAIKEHKKLESEQDQLKTTIKKAKANVATQIQNIIDSKKTLADTDSNLQAARTNASTAYKAALNSLTLAKAHGAAAKKGELKGGLSDEHDQYLAAEAKVKEIHEAAINAVKVLHESKLEKNEEEKRLKDYAARQETLAPELEAATALVNSIASEQRASQEETEKRKESAAKAKAKQQEVAEAAKPKPMTFGTMVSKLKLEQDHDAAFDLREKLEAKSKEGLSMGRSPTVIALEKEKLASAEADLTKFEGTVGAMENEPTPAMRTAEAKLAKAKESKDPVAIQSAEKSLQQIIEIPPDELAKRNELVSRVEAAKAAGDNTKLQAAKKMLNDQDDALQDPDSLAGQLVKLREALAQAEKDCNYDPSNEKVISLKNQLKELTKAADAEYRGKRTDMMIKMAMSDANGGTKKIKPVQPKNEANSEITEAEGQLAEAKKNGDEKLVQKLEAKIAELKGNSN